MSDDTALASSAKGGGSAIVPPDGSGAAQVPRAAMLLLAGVALLALVASGLLWQRLGNIQEQLARQSSESAVQAIEARSLAKQASDQSRETAARLAMAEARLSEATLQRAQLEELMQSLSRSRDENLVVDIESAVRLAVQQAQLTGSVEPLLAALKTADQRVQRAAQPRLANLQRAISKDLGRIQSTTLSDTPGLLVKLDELVRMADDAPLANSVGPMASRTHEFARGTPDDDGVGLAWWQKPWQIVKREARSLLRISRIEQPESALLSPEQSFFVRENIKLKLLNARLGLLARQLESARADVGAASMALNKYYDPASRKTQNAATLLQQVQAQMRTLELPRVDETLAALATAAAGR